MALSRVELQRAYAEQAKTINTRRRSALAETITEMIEPNRLTLDVISRFMRFDTLNPGDNVKRMVRKGKYIARSFVPGMDLLTDKLSKQEKYLYMYDAIYAGTSADTWAIESGDVDTVEKMRSDLAADLAEALALKAFDLLGSVWNSTDTPNNFLDASSTGITAVGLDALIETIIDEVGSVRAIVGTRKALLPVYKFAGYREISNTVGGTPNPLSTILPIPDQLYAYENGLRVSNYHGIPLVELPNTRRNRLPNLQEKVVDTTKVLVIGDFPGTFYQIGDVDFYDNTDTSRIPPVYNLYALTKYAVLIDMIEAIAVAKVAAS